MRFTVASAFLIMSLQAAAPAVAQAPGLVIQIGETWIFRLENGQPAGAHEATPATELAENELMVQLQRESGTTMIVTNNTKSSLNYRATLSLGDQERPSSVCTVASNGRMAFENWNPDWPITAIRLSNFSVADDNRITCQ